jgi:hypothetical protein
MPREENRVSILEHLVVAIILGSFFAISTINIIEPGLYYDEINFGNAALGNIDGSFVAAQVQLGHINIPLMLMKYIGAIKSWIFALIFFLFGVSPATIRVPSMIIGGVALILMYLLVRKLFDRKLALLSLLLTATDPSYIFQMRLDWGPVALMMLFKLGSLLFLFKWLESKSMKYLALAALFLGLGLYDKTNFLWYIIALTISLSLLYRQEIFPQLNFKTISIFIIIFALGCFPLIAYNLMTHGATFSDTGHLPFGYTGINSKISALIATLDGNAVYGFINDGATPAVSNYSLETFLPYFLSFAIAYIVILCLESAYNKKPMQQKSMLFFLCMLSIIYVLIFMTPKASGSYHIMMLYPFPQVIISWVAIDILGRNGKSINILTKKFVFGAIILLILLLTASNLAVDYKYVTSLQSGGSGTWSDEIYELVDYAKSKPNNDFILMDWGFNTQLLSLSGGKIHKEEIFWSFIDEDNNSNDQQKEMDSYMLNKKNLFVFHSSRYTQFPHPRQIFEQVLEMNGFNETVIREFHQKDGKLVYFISSIDQRRI